MIKSDPRKQKLKMEHRCVSCGKQDERTKSGRTQCVACAEKSRESYRRYMAKRYVKLREEHKCIACGAQDKATLAGKTRCLECAAKNANRQAVRYYKMAAEKRCRECGTVLEKDWYFVICPRCRERKNERERKHARSE